MFKHRKFENNVLDNCSLKGLTLMCLLIIFLLSSFAPKKSYIITHLFQKLIYETQNNLHQLTTHMSTLIIWHNRFSENYNDAVEAHITQYRDSKRKKLQHRDSKTKQPRHREFGAKRQLH